MTGKAIMIVGTASDAGKSTIVTALCRYFTELGFKVAPFKSQNMSLNSYVTQDGKEIARSQVVQAIAARIEPQIEHNPILLKPKGQNRSQLILMGKPFIDYEICDYYSKYTDQIISYVQECLYKLLDQNDLVVIEGAGSPVEINLMDHDIANLYIAKLIGAPVLIVADIERGGVFASLYGTYTLLSCHEQSLIKGFLINKFRGEEKLLIPGILKLEQLIQRPCLGIIPYLSDLSLPAEDSMNLKNSNNSGNINIRIIKLPKISNFTDFEPLLCEEQINISYCTNSRDLNDADLIIIPGTKNSVDDMEWMKNNGFFEKLYELHQTKKIILGICGGYEILGLEIIDHAIESDQEKSYRGLGLLNITTEFKNYHKISRQIQAKLQESPYFKELTLQGYEIHTGNIEVKGSIRPFIDYQHTPMAGKTNLGISNTTYTVFGTFLHGIWENDQFRQIFLEFIARQNNKLFDSGKTIVYQNIVESNIVKITDIFRKSVNIPKIREIIGI